MSNNNNNVYIRQAKSFGVNILDIPIPKNAVYLRVGNAYIYVTNFEQFKNPRIGMESVECYVMMFENDRRFKKKSLKSYRTIGTAIINFVRKNHLENTKCIVNITNKELKSISPKDRVTGEYGFKSSSYVNFGKTTDFDVKPQWKMLEKSSNC